MNAVLLGWPYAGVVLVAGLLGWLALGPRPADAPPRAADPAWLLALLWPMYLLHQFEEHGVDLRGRHYAFLRDLCATLGHADLAGCPADSPFLFAVNAVGCQVAFALAWRLRRTRPLVAACAWGIPLVNCAAHVGGALRAGAYNPGLGTSLLLFAPLSLLVLRAVVRARQVSPAQLLRVVGTGLLVHGVLLASLLLRERGVLGAPALLAINGANGLWPLVLGWSRPPRGR